MITEAFESDYLEEEDKQFVVSELDRLMRDEPDKKIVENMVGDNSWSLKTWLQKSDTPFLLVTTKDQSGLTSVSISYQNNLPSSPKNGVRVGARMWIAPAHRNTYMPTCIHINTAVNQAIAQKASYVWTSFNSDRKALMRRIQMLKTNEDPFIRHIWQDWKIKEVPVVINNVMQYYVYRPLFVK